MAHIFEAFKKGSLVIMAHIVAKVSLVIVAHEKSDRPYLCIHVPTYVHRFEFEINDLFKKLL